MVKVLCADWGWDCWRPSWCWAGRRVAAGPGLHRRNSQLRDGAQAYLIGYPLVTMHATRQALIQPPAR